MAHAARLTDDRSRSSFKGCVSAVRFAGTYDALCMHDDVYYVNLNDLIFLSTNAGLRRRRHRVELVGRHLAQRHTE